MTPAANSKQRHEMALLQKRGSLGRRFPGAGLLPQQPATDRHRCSGISGTPGYGLCICRSGILCRRTDMGHRGSWVGRSACVAVAFYTALGAVRGSSSAMRWRCYTRGGAWGATRRDNVSCPNNPQRTGAGVQEYRGPRVMVFVFVAAASYAAGRGRGPRGAMRWRRYKRGGARVSRSAFVAAASYAAGRGRGSSSAMRWRCYRREGSWVAAPSLSPLFGTISPGIQRRTTMDLVKRRQWRRYPQ